MLEEGVSVKKRRGKTRNGRECDQIAIIFPTVKAKGNRPRAYEYRVRAFDAGGTKLAEAKVYSPFINCPESQEPAESVCVLPAYGLYVRHVDGLQLDNASFPLAPGTSDRREPMVFDDVCSER